MPSRLDIIRFYLGQLGKPGLLGILLLLGSAVFLSTVVLPKKAALESLAERNAQARKAVAGEQARAAGVEAAGTRPPLAPEAVAALRRLFQAADESGLELAQGDYRYVAGKDADIPHYQFQFPVYGNYADIRNFLGLALNNEPALALGSIQLRREAIEETELDVTLGFTLYLRAAP